jgi:hypothetical protein
VAKKARTPAPPRRPVQAPQRRDAKRRKQAPDRSRLVWITVILAVVAAAAIGSALYFALRGGGGGGSKAATPQTYNSLPGVRKIKAPWPPEYAHLDDRLAPLHLDELQQEQLAYHIHQHLDIFLNGKPIAVPASIGIFPNVYLTQLHTHDPSGIIHVESATNRHYTLGQFFAEWGVYLDSRCVGAYCQGYTWYVNGKKQSGSPVGLELQPHQEIVIAIGKPPKQIPSKYPANGP